MACLFKCFANKGEFEEMKNHRQCKLQRLPNGVRIHIPRVMGVQEAQSRVGALFQLGPNRAS